MISNNRMKTTLNMRFDEEMLEELKKIADKKGIKYQTMVRNILIQFIEEHKEK